MHDIQPRMKNPSILLVAGFLALAGCAAPQQPAVDQPRAAAVKNDDRQPPEFLADLPSLKQASLAMTEEEFMDMVHQQKLLFERQFAYGKATYLVHPREHVLVIFGFQDGRCTGIQRMKD